jgi:dTDP-4-amino-4,6-dideoxygalactose transaminase
MALPLIDVKDFSRFDPVPQAGIDRAVSIMQSGELFRYCGTAESSEVALLEREFADYVGTRYALGVNSCTAAIELALLTCGVVPGTPVLLPGFTFTAVPSAIVGLHAKPVFVECTDQYRIDLDDLRLKARSGVRYLLLSHMRGHCPDMSAVTAICDEYGIVLIEDAAHALGGSWSGRRIGSFGRAGCFSFQSNKIINAGEGGVLVTDDEELIAKAVCLSGAYEQNYRKHPIRSELFAAIEGAVPVHNTRMTNLTAAIARPQLAELEEKAHRHRQTYALLKQELSQSNRIELAREVPEETRVPDSVQFRVTGFGPDQTQLFVDRLRRDGLPISRFAERANARSFENWHYLNGDMPDLPQTRAIISTACDMRLPSSLTQAHLVYLAGTVISAIQEIDRN